MPFCKAVSIWSWLLVRPNQAYLRGGRCLCSGFWGSGRIYEGPVPFDTAPYKEHGPAVLPLGALYLRRYMLPPFSKARQLTWLSMVFFKGLVCDEASGGNPCR